VENFSVFYSHQWEFFSFLKIMGLGHNMGWGQACIIGIIGASGLCTG